MGWGGPWVTPINPAEAPGSIQHYPTAFLGEPLRVRRLALYLLRGLYPAGLRLSSILPSVLEVGLSDNQLKHFYQKRRKKRR